MSEVPGDELGQSSERKRREEIWLGKLIEPLDSELASHTKDAAEEVTELIERAARRDLRIIESEDIHEAQIGLLYALLNRGEYVTIVDAARGWIAAKDGPVSPHASVLILTSTLLQILEGGLKQHLRLLWWAGSILKSVPFEPKWDEPGQKYLHNALEGLRAVLPSDSTIRAEFEPFWEPSGKNFLNRIRRGLAHSDFRVLNEEGTIGVQLQDSDEMIFLSNERLWEICRRLLDAEMVFHVGVHLGKCRVHNDLPFLPEDGPPEWVSSNE